MNLVARQWEFAKDVADLIAWVAEQPGMSLTFGEAYRTNEQQALHVKAGKSWTMNSRHQERMAVDLNLFIDGTYVGLLPQERQRELYKPLGDWWRARRPENKWGIGPRDNPTGDWNHFERS